MVLGYRTHEDLSKDLSESQISQCESISSKIRQIGINSREMATRKVLLDGGFTYI
jgi:hypothetical protein